MIIVRSITQALRVLQFRKVQQVVNLNKDRVQSSHMVVLCQQMLKEFAIRFSRNLKLIHNPFLKYHKQSLQSKEKSSKDRILSSKVVLIHLRMETIIRKREEGGS